MPYTALIVDDDEHTRLIYERIKPGYAALRGGASSR